VKTAAILAALLFVVALALAPGYVDDIDSRIVLRTTERLLDARTTALPYDEATCGKPGEYGAVLPYGTFEMKFGLGNALLAAPFVAGGRAVFGAAGLSREKAGEVGASLASALWFAAAGVLVFRLARRHVGARGGAFVATVYSLATYAVVYGKSAYLETPLTVAVLASYDAALRLRERPDSRRAAAALGLACAAAIWIKLAGALTLLGVAPILAAPALRRSPRGPLVAAAVAALGVAALLATNVARFGSAFESGYAGSARFDHPLVEGVGVLLASRRGGIFVYSPLLLFAIPGTATLARRDAAFAWGIWIAFAASLVLCAKFFSPFGGEAWGPRYLIPNAALLAVPAGVAARDWLARDAARRGLAAGVVAFSAALQVPPAFVAFTETYGLEKAVGREAVEAIGAQRITTRVLVAKARRADDKYELADLGLGDGTYAPGSVERGLDVWPERVARDRPKRAAAAWTFWWTLVAASAALATRLVRTTSKEAI